MPSAKDGPSPSKNRGLLVGAELNGVPPLLRQARAAPSYFVGGRRPERTQGLRDLGVTIGRRSIELDTGVPKNPGDRFAAEVGGLSQYQRSVVEEQLHRPLPHRSGLHPGCGKSAPDPGGRSRGLLVARPLGGGRHRA